MISCIEDFAAIKARLAQIEQEKPAVEPKPEVQPTTWMGIPCGPSMEDVYAGYGEALG